MSLWVYNSDGSDAKLSRSQRPGDAPNLPKDGEGWWWLSYAYVDRIKIKLYTIM